MTNERIKVKFLGSLISAKTGVTSSQADGMLLTHQLICLSHGHVNHRNRRALTTPNSFHITRNNSDFESRLTRNES